MSNVILLARTASGGARRFRLLGAPARRAVVYFEFSRA